MIFEHSATVLPFTDARLRPPGKGTLTTGSDGLTLPERERPDNVIVLASFSRRARRAHPPHWLGGPPDGEAA